VAAVVAAMVLAVTGCRGTAQDRAPGFSLENALGAPVALADYSGTPVLLFFHMADG
jgi:peroxiredoxin